jgi:flagellar basal body-associated protein FliL
MSKSPNDMRSSERLEEIASILAEGVLRLKQKISRKPARLRDISLDSFANQSVHAIKPKTGKKA